MVALLVVVNKGICSWEDAPAVPPRNNETKIRMVEPLFVARRQHFLDSLPQEKADNSQLAAVPGRSLTVTYLQFRESP